MYCVCNTFSCLRKLSTNCPQLRCLESILDWQFCTIWKLLSWASDYLLKSKNFNSTRNLESRVVNTGELHNGGHALYVMVSRSSSMEAILACHQALSTVYLRNDCWVAILRVPWHKRTGPILFICYYFPCHSCTMYQEPEAVLVIALCWYPCSRCGRVTKSISGAVSQLSFHTFHFFLFLIL